MFNTPDVEIRRNSRGYYTLYMNGDFVGNFDTVQEASQEAEDILREEREQIA